MNSYRDLFVWNAAVDLAVRISEFGDALIRRRRYALADQLQRASLSVPNNIAEGMGRLTIRDTRHYLGVARGSLFELDTQLEVCRRAHLLSESRYAEYHDAVAKIGAGLSHLIARRS